MVNVRATLARAEAERILSAESRRALERFGKSLYFPRRNWEALFEGAAEQGLTETERAALIDWLPRGRVDQKRADALEMLAAIAQAIEQPSPTPAGGDFNFEWTCFWEEFVARADAVDEAALTRQQQSVLEELKLDGLDAYQRVEAMAVLRLVATRGAARRANAAPPPDELQSTLTRLRARLGLFTRSDLERWIVDNDLDAASLESLVASEKGIADLRDRFRTALGPHILDELRVSGEYKRLAERARMKSDKLDGAGVASAATAPGSRPIDLRLWFFEQRLRRPLPENFEDFARRLGFALAADFDAALHREWMYLETRRAGRDV
jgi:hypothetical protein